MYKGKCDKIGYNSTKKEEKNNKRNEGEVVVIYSRKGPACIEQWGAGRKGNTKKK